MIKSLVLKNLLNTWQKYFIVDGLTEIIINKEYEVWLEINNEFILREDKKISSQFLLDFCEQLANYRNLYFNINNPHLSCSIPETNIRVQALHPSITAFNNLSLTMRIPSNKLFNLEDFILNKNLEYNYEDIKSFIVNRKNILVSGGTGSGKTSFINALLQTLPLNERIITIEDSSELKINNKNQVNIIVSKNDQKAYTYRDGLNDAMRMRPDRILVGEIDTRNTMLFLRLSNTGHNGIISTIHANSVKDAINAVTLNAKFDGSDIEVDTLIKYFTNAIDFVIQILKINNKRVIQDILDVKSGNLQ